MVNDQFLHQIFCKVLSSSSYGQCFQGGMDVQYLSGRYEKGKIAVCKYMQKRHCTVQHRSIVLAHGGIVEKQARLGPSTFLGSESFRACWGSVHKIFLNACQTYCRLTILVVDNTLWPSRSSSADLGFMWG